MEFEIDFDPERSLVALRTSGDAEFAGFEALLKALLDDPRWQPGMDVLADYSTLEMPAEAGDAFMVRIVAMHAPLAERLGSGRCAVVAGSPAKFGLARMFEQLAEPALEMRFHTVRSWAEGEAWLVEERAKDEG